MICFGTLKNKYSAQKDVLKWYLRVLNENLVNMLMIQFTVQILTVVVTFLFCETHFSAVL